MAMFPTGLFCTCSIHTSSLKLSLLGRIFCLVAIFAGLEFTVGHISHSLALQADSGHMMSDGLALAIALFATYMARSSAASKEYRSFSQNVETWAALINGLGLLGMAGLIAWEAYSHWQAPPNEILSLPMLITAIIGLVINGISFQWLQSFNNSESENPSGQHSTSSDLNIHGVLLHVLADVFGSVGVILAAIAVWIWGWTWADNLISVGLSILIGGSALSLIQKSITTLHLSLGQTQSSISEPSRRINGQASELYRVGFYEIGQTNLSQMVKERQSSDSQPYRT